MRSSIPLLTTSWLAAALAAAPDAAPSDGEVACTRIPPISFSIMTMSPGVISIFSSISSRASTSMRMG